jgi:hypothetical protein
MRAWFMVGALLLGIIGFWGAQGPGRTGRPGIVDDNSPARAMDGGSTIPTPRNP